MIKESLIFGPPGCGKTHTLIDIVRKHLDNNGNPEKVGFVSFSRKSVMEARDRISKDLSSKQIPWFRTLHSIGYRWLGMRDENMLTRYDFNKIGKELGLVFDHNTATNLQDGLIPVSTKEGNKYLEIMARAVMRKVPLEVQYSNFGDHDLHWPALVKTKKVYDSFKEENNKYDFTDMIDLFVKGGSSPELELLIVDEAQDLTPLQWDQVKLMKSFTQEIWYAGDDDQCIHRWNGVEVSDFINACEGRSVLQKSYRVPRSVHSLANKISSKIGYRQEKTWSPTDMEGSVNYHLNVYDVDIDKGSWTIMARTNRLVSGIARTLREDGYLFNHYGKPSLNTDLLENMNIWKRLVSDEPVSILDIKKLYKMVPKQGEKAIVKRGFTKQLDFLDEQLFFTFQELQTTYGLLAEKTTNVFTVLNVPPEDRLYMRAVERRGEMFDKPRINISTIHAMKGGEDDNVILLSESSRAAVTDEKQQDDEHRVFYTGVTRTRHNLHIIDTDSRFKYNL